MNNKNDTDSPLVYPTTVKLPTCAELVREYIEIKKNAYEELKIKNYDLYIEAIKFAQGLIENMRTHNFKNMNKYQYLEEEIIKYTLTITTPPIDYYRLYWDKVDKE